MKVSKYKHLIKKATGIFLLSILCISIFLTGCQRPADLPDDDDKHSHKTEETEHYIIKNSQTDYKVLIPDNAGETLLFGAEELTYFFQRATGILLPIVKNSDADLAGGKFLSLGETSVKSSAGISTDESYGKDGFRLYTKDRNIVMFGNEDTAALYAVYEFLSYSFDFEVFYKDSIQLKENVTELKLLNFDVVEIPDFSLRTVGSATLSGNDIYRQRLRMDTWADCFLPINGHQTHNTLKILDPNVYNKEEHTNWYNSGRTQLSYTARGDEASYNAMLDEAARVIGEAIKGYSFDTPEEEVRIQFSIMDNSGWDDSAASKAMLEQYKANSGSVIKACNDLSTKISAWMNSTEGQPYKRKFSIYFLAYERAEDAPVTTINGVHTPTIRCADNVFPLLAPINIDYTRSIYDTVNKQYHDLIEKWAVVADSIFLWTYSTNFNHYLTMYDNFSETAEWYQFINKNGIKMIHDQSQGTQYGGATGFQIYKQYLQAKLSWNVNLDVAKLTNRFFDNYFANGSATMLKLFEEMRVHTATLKELEDDAYGGIRSVYFDVKKDIYWPKQLLYKWYDYTNQALEEILPLKDSNYDLYITTYNHITLERLQFIFLLNEIYENSIEADTLAKIRAEFKADVLRIGITNVSEHASITGVIAEW